jgi:hypothetical protein
MAYAKDGYPIEQASKIGHLKLTNHPVITSLISSFELPDAPDPATLPQPTGKIDVAQRTTLDRIVTIDGGQASVPNVYRSEKKLAFVQVAACMLKLSDLRYMSEHPMMDPRDWKRLTEHYWYHPAVLPLSGFQLPFLTLKETMRTVIDATLTQTRLYETLRFLIYREWDQAYNIPEDEKPAMECWSCGVEFQLPRHSMGPTCPHCGHAHRLSDYLRIGADSPDTWAREEAASNLRDLLETLTLFHFARIYRGQPALGSTLFIKDGPLLLRAQLSRLIEPIRDYLVYMRENGCPLHIVGVEKTGDYAEFVEGLRPTLSEPGDFFLPDVRFLVEEVSGGTMAPNYRNRVSYGAKVAIKIGQDHVLALNVPTGEFRVTPTPDDLLGFEESVRALSELPSYQYPNALVPLVLANGTVSIARRPSGGILQAFADQMVGARRTDAH